jgi:hypothetical protein
VVKTRIEIRGTGVARGRNGGGGVLLQRLDGEAKWFRIRWESSELILC